MSLTDQIPGLREAVEKEQFIRDTAFLDIPEQICGIDVKPLTLRHVLALSLVGSPFMVGGNPSPVDCAQFLWCVSTSWSPHSRWRRKLFIRRCRRLKFSTLAKSIEEFVDEAFQDSPATTDCGDRQSFYSFAASIVDTFASEYGWPAHYIIDMPAKQLFQLMSVIRKRKNPAAILFNPSEKVRGRWLDQINSKNL